MTDRTDVLIVGGGPVGGSLALALKDSGFGVTVLEAQPDSVVGEDPRALALSYGSRQILERIGVWPRIHGATPIERIHVSQKGGFGVTRMSAAEAGIPALGYVIDYILLNRAVRETVTAGGLTFLGGATVNGVHAGPDRVAVEFERDGVAHQVDAGLLVVADGGRSLAGIQGFERRERDYRQTAVIANVRTELPHGNVAYERFTPAGPMALLPNGAGFALVWTMAPEAAEEVAGLSDGAFLARLHQHFGDRLGAFTAVQRRAGFPLKLKYAVSVAGRRTVLIGNAAQTLHPVTGQGFNLGVRDAWELGAAIRAAAPGELGSEAMLERYRRGRRPDSRGGMFFTDSLVRLFSNADPTLELGRGLGLAALDVLPPIKHFLMGRMIYGARG
jgi:2-octaprenyl-6-methoxyphenol hydroxylase